MTASGTQYGIHAGAEVLQNIQRHKGLDRSGKSTAMDTEGSAAAEQLFCQSKRDGQILMLLTAGWDHVLQIHPGGAAGGLDQLQKTVEVSTLERGNLFGDAAVFLIDMDSAQHRPVTGFTAQCRQFGVKGILRDFAQMVFAEMGADDLELPRGAFKAAALRRMKEPRLPRRCPPVRS